MLKAKMHVLPSIGHSIKWNIRFTSIKRNSAIIVTIPPPQRRRDLLRSELKISQRGSAADV
jgi:hypothetical protein